MAHSIKRIRTLALVGQAGAGKTSLAEALLARRGAIPAPGSVERGSTVCDYTPLEKQLQHSLKLAVASFDFAGTPDPPARHAGLPGLPRPRAARARRGRDRGDRHQRAERHRDDDRRASCSGRRSAASTAWSIVNKIDADNVDLEALLERIQQAFGKECLPLNLPGGKAQQGVGLLLRARRAKSDFSSVEDAHRKLIDQVVEVDEKLMERYLEKGEVTPEELHEPLERALREGHLIPVVFTSAKTGAGIAELLEVIVKLLPNPAEGNPPAYISTPAGGGEPTELHADARSGPARARARVQDRDRSLHRPRSRCSACTRAASRPARSSTSAKAGSRSRPGTSTCCAARRRSR
mgnify:CR=1 FL=1